MRQRRRAAISPAAALVAGGLVASALAARAAGQTIVHRYNFNTDGSANDSVGAANGTLQANGTISGGSLNTTGTPGQASGVSLPDSATTGITGSFSIEQYFTYTGTADFSTLFSFGDDTNDYVVATPRRGDPGNPSSIDYNPAGGGSTLFLGPTVPTGVENHLVTTYSPASNSIAFYLNGVLVAGNAPTAAFNLQTVAAGRAGINGNAPFAADASLNGSTNEFRIYTGAMNIGAVRLNTTLGANTVTAVQNAWAFAGTGDFNTNGNWALGHVPTATANGSANELALIANGGTATVSATLANPTQVKITSGGLTVSGAGVVFTPAGGVDLAPGNGPGTAALTISGGAVLATPGIFLDGDVTTTGGTAAKTITMDNGGTIRATATFTTSAPSVSGTLNTPGGGVIDTNGNTVTLAFPFAGGGPLIKAGAGVLNLGADSTYSGGTQFNGGLLAVIAPGRLGTGGYSFTGGTLWVLGGSAFNSSAPIVLNNTAAGTPAGTIQVNNLAGTTLSGGITSNASTQEFQKTGPGPLTLSGTNNTGGSAIFLRGGTTTINSGLLSTNFFFDVGQTSGDNATLNVGGNATIGVANSDFNVSDINSSIGNFFYSSSGTSSVKTLYVGKGGTTQGAARQTAGTIQSAAGPGDWRVADAIGATGAYYLSGGTLSTTGNFQVGATGKGVLTQTNGNVNVGSFSAVGRFAGGIGVQTVSGGIYSQTNTGAFMLVGEDGNGTLNVRGSGTANFANNVNNTGLRLGHTGTGVGTVNLGAGGTISARAVTRGAGSATFNFHGGTLKSNGANATFMTGLTNAYVWSEGGIIDTSGFDVTIGQILADPSGSSGVSSVALTGNGTGYVAAPMVQITGGGGTGASAIANLDPATNQLTGITVTNPGRNYASAPTVTLVGGNPATAATVDTASIAANAGGGLTKSGAGILTLTAANTYPGGTTIAGGVLLASNTTGSATGAGAVSVNSGGTLGGTGVIGNIAGPVSITSGGTLAPGASVGTLTTGAENWNPGGAYTWELTDPAGVAGTTGWDLAELSTATLTVNSTQATPFTINIVRVGPGAAGVINPNLWFTIAHAGTVTGFAANAFTLPDPGGGDQWEIRTVTNPGGGFDVQVGTVPEPSSAVTLAALAAARLLRRRRRRGATRRHRATPA